MPYLQKPAIPDSSADPARVHTGADMLCVRFDCALNQFSCDAWFSATIAGDYENRSLWDALRDGAVCERAEIDEMELLFRRAQAGADVSGELVSVVLRTADGSRRRFSFRVLAEFGTIDEQTPQHLTLLFFDEEANAQRLAIPETDALTKLMTQAAFLRRVNQRIKSGRANEYVILFFDVNRFSVINERFGYQRGDTFLQFIALLTSSLLPASSLCCRIGGDDFAVCMTYNGTLIGRFIEEFTQALHQQETPFEITVNFGLYIVEDPALAADVALDRAMFAQKGVKGNYLTRYAYYDANMRRARVRRQEITGQMNAALTSGQFEIFIQPQYELATGKLIGGEVLSRWFHPEMGRIMPGEFIPIFEQNGFITKLDGFVWERTCQLLRKWLREEGDAVTPLSVNLSRVHLFDSGIVDQLAELVERYSIPPSMLRLEITESAYSESPERLIRVVQALQERGFLVEMDDFGSGYSSLNILKDVPVGLLKLDLRFLAGDDPSGRGGSIVNSVIRMAKWLQLPVVAEGVETQQQADYLRSVGCDYAQGYLYSKPIPVYEFETLMRATPHLSNDVQPFVTDMANANAFWNPDSQETLIFNSYVGGAAIIEYSENHITLLRANDKFRSIMQLTNTDRANGFFSSLSSIMPKRDRTLYNDMLEQAIASGDETTCTARLFSQQSRNDFVWVRSRARILARSRSYTIFYLAVDDVTAEHEAQARFRKSQDTLLAAAAHTHLQYWRYDMVNHTSVQGVEPHEYDCGVPIYLDNYPQSLIDLGYIHPDYVDAYLKLHADLINGAREVSADILSGGEGHWEWRKVRYSAIVDDDGVVRSAIGTSEELAAYKELEERFIIAAQQAGLWTWTVDIAEKRIHTEMLHHLGKLNETVIERLPEAFVELGRVHPEDVDVFCSMYYAIYNGAAEASSVARLRPMDGSNGEWRYMRSVLSVVCDKDGRTNTAVGTATDVHELVSMQRRYQEAETYYKSLDPKNYLSIYRANITKRLIETPDGTCDYDAYLERVLERIPDMSERAYMADALSIERFQKDYAKGASRFHYEYRIHLTDRSTALWVRTVIRVLFEPDTQYLVAFIYTQNINLERMQQTVFSGIVREGCDFVTIINPVTDRYSMFLLEKDESLLPDKQLTSFSAAAADYARRTAHPDDAESYIRYTRPEYMLKRFELEPTYAFLYRSMAADGTQSLCRITLHLIDPYTKHVCMTRLNVDSVLQKPEEPESLRD